MAKISVIRQCLTHSLVAVIAFQFGLMTISSKCLLLEHQLHNQHLAALSSAARTEEWDLKMMNDRRIQNINNKKRNEQIIGNGAISKEASIIDGERIIPTSVSSPSSSSPPPEADNNTPVKDFIHGMAWIPRNQFAKKFDVGVALDNLGAKNINNTVLLVYADEKSLPTNTKNNEGSRNRHHQSGINTMTDPSLATENCDELSIFISRKKQKKRCIAIMENWGGSAHVFRFLRNGVDEPGPLRLGGRFFDGGGGGAPRWQMVSISNMTL